MMIRTGAAGKTLMELEGSKSINSRASPNPSRIDDLMREFKPDSFKKLPGIVSILDAEMARLARSAKEETGSAVSRFKNFFKKKGKT